MTLPSSPNSDMTRRFTRVKPAHTVGGMRRGIHIAVELIVALTADVLGDARTWTGR